MLSLLTLLAACGSPKDTADTADTADTTDTADTAALEPTTVWYFGTSEGRTPDGSYEEDPKDILFIRGLDPPAAHVYEYAWQKSRFGVAYFELTHDVDVEAGTFTSSFTTKEGTISVEGGYDAGEPWLWTAWHSTSTYLDGKYMGMVVTSQDQMDEAGVATAHKEVYDGTGEHIWSIVEVITPTDEASFDERLTEWTK